MTETDFWKDFWPNFASSIVTGVLFTFVITFIIQQLRKPKLKISLSIGTGTKNRHSLTFYCINEGAVGLMENELQWHVYFDLALRPDESFSNPYKMIHFDNRPYNYFSGTNIESCLPGTSIELITIPVKKNDRIAEQFGDIEWLDQATYYYSITTTRGQMKYETFWDIFKKSKVISDGSFVKRRIFEIKEKVR